MKIKNHKNKNRYVLTSDNVWVRDPFGKSKPYDINKLTSEKDYSIFMSNEILNSRIGIPQIDMEGFVHNNVLIVSDGMNFEKNHTVCSLLPSSVTIIAVNGALAKWKLVGPDCPSAKKRSISYYVANSPYQQLIEFLPRKNRYYPKCIVSSRSNNEFVEYYASRGTVYRYQPTPEIGFSGYGEKSLFTVDDYRNPICAALGLALKFGAEKIAFLCCDNSFPDPLPGAVQVRNNAYCYPQHTVAHRILDGIFYWMGEHKFRDFSVIDCSSGPEYQNCTYISPERLEESLVRFFEGST